ncbi:MAG TPA: response regulator transcription factor [Ignavibacteriales bacterium]|nr:response regulator transcription factor [Ignavibacteriales bacterium]
MEKFKAAIADDSELIRQRMIRKLERIPEIELLWQTGDGRMAFEWFLRKTPDIMILDVQMPSMTGIEILQRLRPEKPGKTIFIVLTNDPAPIVKKKCLEAGADYFFDKTTEFDRIFEVIRSVSQNNTYETR